MKRVAIITILALLLVPFTAGAAPESETTGNVPVEPPLVREGDFAVRLSEALGLATAPTEPEAESKLSSRGISPDSGWIADYPMTPLVIGELRKALTESAESGRLAMSKDEAIQRLDNVASEYQLTIVPSTEEAYAGYSEGVEDNLYEAPTLEDERFAGESADVLEHYHEHGPPVVTYYPPPPHYGYLYDWVPYPFFFTGALFSGFFLLHDFHRPVTNVFVFKDRDSFPFRRFVSNRRFDPITRRFNRIDARDRFGTIAAVRARGGIRDPGLLSRNGGLVGRNGRLAANEAVGRNRLLEPGARQSAQAILRQDAQRRADITRSARTGNNSIADARSRARENRQALQNRNSRLLQNDRIMREGGRAGNRVASGTLNSNRGLGRAGQAAVRARQGIRTDSNPALRERGGNIQGRAQQRLNRGEAQRFSSQRQNRMVNNRLNRGGSMPRSFQSPQSRSRGTAFRGVSPMNRGSAGGFRPGGRSFAPGGTAFRSGGGFRSGGSSFRSSGGFRSGGASVRSGGGARTGGGGFRGGGGSGRGGRR